MIIRFETDDTSEARDILDASRRLSCLIDIDQMLRAIVKYDQGEFAGIDGVTAAEKIRDDMHEILKSRSIDLYES